jgi:F-type H+-transporting ATPase subunit b
MNKFFALTLILLASAIASAADHGSHGGHGAGLDEHTLKTIMYQAINVGILVVALIYFLKDGVRQYFKDKQTSYLAAAEKAQAVRRQAEQSHMEIKVQLTKLESTADESISRARAEAADLRNQMVAEAQAMSKRIREEAEAAARLEVERAQNALRVQMIQEASKLAEQTFKEKVSGEDHRRLQGDFIQNIEAVQS